MKTVVKLAGLIVLALSLTACPGGNKKKGASFSDRGARATSVPTAAQRIQPSTKVFSDDRNWMTSVKRLVSASIPEEYLAGDVSSYDSSNDRSGVYLGARLCLQGSGYQTQTVPTNALVVVHVYDQYEVPVPIYLNAVNGTLSNGRLSATFQDEYGSIRLDAQVYGSYAEGVVSFDTRIRYDGSTDSRGMQRLGYFYLSTQELFSCY